MKQLTIRRGLRAFLWLAAGVAMAASSPSFAQRWRAPELPAGARLVADQAYGNAARQKLDVFLPAPVRQPPTGAPILVMVHGGAWVFGDKASLGVVGAKPAHWVAHGWIFVSVNNRLFPEAAPAEQGDDVADALAWVQAHAPEWHGDLSRVVLMGHSAGAHLVALLGASPARAAARGVRPWAATVVLDSAALDLEALMRERHARFYDRVFGVDPAAWPAASPTARLADDATPMLLVCSSERRDDSCAQAERFGARLRERGVRADVLPQALRHNEIDTEIGKPGPYTAAVDAFIAAVLPP